MMSRDMLVAEIARALRAALPDKANDLLRELEGRLAPEVATLNLSTGPLQVFRSGSGLALHDLLRLSALAAMANCPWPAGMRAPLLAADFDDLQRRANFYGVLLP